MHAEQSVQADQMWRKSPTERVVVTNVEGDQVETILHDDSAGTSAVWITNRYEFAAFELLETA